MHMHHHQHIIHHTYGLTDEDVLSDGCYNDLRAEVGGNVSRKLNRKLNFSNTYIHRVDVYLRCKYRIIPSRENCVH